MVGALLTDRSFSESGRARLSLVFLGFVRELGALVEMQLIFL